MEEKILFIGPIADQGGPAIKNSIMVRALEKTASLEIHNTYDKKTRSRLGAIRKILFGRQRFIIVAVSRKGRNLLYPFLLLRKKASGIRYCCVVIGGNADKSFRSGSAVEAMRKADLVTAETRGILGSLRDAYGLENDYWLPNYKVLDGYETAGNSSARFQASPLRFLFLSSMRNAKGVKTLLRAFRTVLAEGSEAELDFYGPIRDDFDRDLLEEIRQAEHIRYCGAVENSMVLDIMRQYQVFVFPTEYTGEGFPAVLAEAMAAGLPVISSDMNENPEIIREGRNGWLFAHGNEEELADRLRTCLRSRDVLARMSENNLEDARDYDASVVLEAFASKLRSLGWPV